MALLLLGYAAAWSRGVSRPAGERGGEGLGPREWEKIFQFLLGAMIDGSPIYD
jgi:hypothetical protein